MFLNPYWAVEIHDITTNTYIFVVTLLAENMFTSLQATLFSNWSEKGMFVFVFAGRLTRRSHLFFLSSVLDLAEYVQLHSSASNCVFLTD